MKSQMQGVQYKFMYICLNKPFDTIASVLFKHLVLQQVFVIWISRS